MLAFCGRLSVFTSPYAQLELGAVEVHHVVPKKPVQDVHHQRLEHHLLCCSSHTQRHVFLQFRFELKCTRVSALELQPDQFPEINMY